MFFQKVMIVLKVTMEKSLMQKGVEGQTFRAFDIQVPYLIFLMVIMHLIVMMLVVKLTMQRAQRGGRKSAPIVENNRGLTLSQLLSTSWSTGWLCWWSWPKQHCIVLAKLQFDNSDALRKLANFTRSEDQPETLKKLQQLVVETVGHSHITSQVNHIGNDLLYPLINMATNKQQIIMKI